MNCKSIFTFIIIIFSLNAQNSAATETTRASCKLIFGTPIHSTNYGRFTVRRTKEILKPAIQGRRVNGVVVDSGQDEVSVQTVEIIDNYNDGISVYKKTDNSGNIFYQKTKSPFYFDSGTYANDNVIIANLDRSLFFDQKHIIEVYAADGENFSLVARFSSGRSNMHAGRFLGKESRYFSFGEFVSVKGINRIKKIYIFDTLTLEDTKIDVFALSKKGLVSSDITKLQMSSDGTQIFFPSEVDYQVTSINLDTLVQQTQDLRPDAQKGFQHDWDVIEGPNKNFTVSE